MLDLTRAKQDCMDQISIGDHVWPSAVVRELTKRWKVQVTNAQPSKLNKYWPQNWYSRSLVPSFSSCEVLQTSRNLHTHAPITYELSDRCRISRLYSWLGSPLIIIDPCGYTRG